MVDTCYKKLVSEIFGPQLDEQNPITDVNGLVEAAEKAMDTLTPDHKAAVKAVCFDGVDMDIVDRQAYAMGMRSLKHPSCSRTLRPYLKFQED